MILSALATTASSDPVGLQIVFLRVDCCVVRVGADAFFGGVAGDQGPGRQTASACPFQLAYAAGRQQLAAREQAGWFCRRVCRRRRRLLRLEYELFQLATLQPAVDFTRLSIVLVITNFRPVDITPLEPLPLP